MIGYQKTVVPQLVNALLSKHDLILLGLRGQAKTRLARALVEFLDPWLPVIEGSPIHEDPYHPVTTTSVALCERHGDDLPVAWIPRDERYQEKLATPDITMADVIGDIDPLKAAAEQRTLMDPEILQFGLIPRTHRGIFCLNELPDLPTRVQVGLFNLLEEKDIQIRGLPLRIPLDLMMVFTANPEDYTNRGNLVTPLRDRIRSQIHTHYPMSRDDGAAITAQESWVERTDAANVRVPEFLRAAVEETAIQARVSSFVDQSSGVSARVTIALMENMVSNAERRALSAGDSEACARPSDLYAALPGIAGKVELVFEGEQEGTQAVCRDVIGKGLKVVFQELFADPLASKEGEGEYQPLLKHFRAGRTVEVSEDASDEDTRSALEQVPGLLDLAQRKLQPSSPGEEAAAMELILEGLHQCSLLAKKAGVNGSSFRDQFDDMVGDLGATGG